MMDRSELTRLAVRQARRGSRLAATTVERLLFRGDALAVARHNAWSAVCEDRRRAMDRTLAREALDPVAEPLSSATGGPFGGE